MNLKLLKIVKSKFMLIAKDLMANPEGLRPKLDLALEKMSKKNVAKSLGGHLDELKVLVRMARSWVNRSYTDFNSQTILYVLIAVIYFLTPTDFVPDFILGLGYVDDIAVVRWVLGIIREDVTKYKKWETINNKGNE